MNRKTLAAAVTFAALLLFSCRPLRAEGWRVEALGVTCSAHEEGVTVCFSSEGNCFNTASLFADVFAVIPGKSETPGVKANFSRLYILSDRMSGLQDGVRMQAFAGPGVSAGYMQDFESGFLNSTDGLSLNPGLVLALSGTFGCRLSFEGGRFLIDAAVMLESGFHCRRDEAHEGVDVSLYLNGFRHVLSPLVTIHYCF